MTNEISKNTTALVRTKLEDIKKRLSKMEEAKNAGTKTNGMFHWNGRTRDTQSESKSINIFKTTSVVLLISILGFIMTRKKEYDEAAKKLKINPYPVFSWSGYSIDSWEDDIKTRINVITHESEVNRLIKLRDELSKYVSEEDRVNELLSQLDNYSAISEDAETIADTDCEVFEEIEDTKQTKQLKVSIL